MDGRIVLAETQGSDPERIYRWLSAGTLLAVTPKDTAHSASAINDDGSAVAGLQFYRESPETGRPFLWSLKDGYRSLPVPDGLHDADPAYFSPDGRKQHGVGYANTADSIDMKSPVIMSWRDGKAETHLRLPLHPAYNSGAFLLLP